MRSVRVWHGRVARALRRALRLVCSPWYFVRAVSSHAALLGRSEHWCGLCARARWVWYGLGWCASLRARGQMWDVRVPTAGGAHRPLYTLNSRAGHVMLCWSPDDVYLLTSAVDNEATINGTAPKTKTPNEPHACCIFYKQKTTTATLVLQPRPPAHPRAGAAAMFFSRAYTSFSSFSRFLDALISVSFWFLDVLISSLPLFSLLTSLFFKIISIFRLGGLLRARSRCASTRRWTAGST